MNYYRFLDSRDIRNYLENMEYPLSTPEAAYLVWQCRRVTLEEKFAAWEEIVDTMPTAPSSEGPLEEGSGWTASTNFSGDYMDLEKNRLEHFTQGENCVFGADFFLLPTRSGERRRLVGKRYSVPELYKLVSPIVVKNSPRKLERCGFGSRHWTETLPQGQSDFDRQTGTPLFGCVSYLRFGRCVPQPVGGPPHSLPPGGHCMGP